MFDLSILGTVADGMRDHPAVAPWLIFGVMLLEGVVATTFIFSATLVILAAGALVEVGLLSYFAVFAAVFVGLWAGDTLNFLLASQGEQWFKQLRVVQRHAGLLSRAEHLIARWGLAAVFLCRFMGPSRPFVTFLAGVLKMLSGRFHLATASSTLLLTIALMQAGMGGMALWDRWLAH